MQGSYTIKRRSRRSNLDVLAGPLVVILLCLVGVVAYLAGAEAASQKMAKINPRLEAGAAVDEPLWWALGLDDQHARELQLAIYETDGIGCPCQAPAREVRCHHLPATRRRILQ
jgi:hypothetical protein